jgi:hypothetical protein
MVNAAVWEFLPPKNSEEKESTVAYLRQFHCLQGFQNIFIPRSAFSSICNVIEAEDSYVKMLPMITREDEKTLESLEESLNSLLWKMKKIEVHDSDLTSFLSAFAIWLQAKRLKAVVILPLSNPTSDFSRLIHFLVGERRDYLGNIAEDIELWFFSHFADLDAEWPYFFDFPLSTANALEEDSYFLKYRRRLTEFRGNYLSWSATRKDWTGYGRAFSNMLVIQGLILGHMAKKYGDRVFVRKNSFAPTKENLKARVNSRWKCHPFGRILKETKMKNESFTPYFMEFDFYPFELLKSIKPTDLLNKKAKPFWYSHAFETVNKAELRTVLSGYRKRIRI